MEKELIEKEVGNATEQVPQQPVEQNQLEPTPIPVEISATDFSANDDEILAASKKALLEGVQPVNPVTPPQEVKPEAENKPEAQEVTPPTETKAEPTTPPANPESDKLFKKESVKIDENYILSQPEAEQAIYRGLKGKRESVELDPQFLKNYVNAQIHIKKQERELEELRSGKNQDWVNVEPKEPEQDLIKTIAFQNLKVKYPDLPETEAGQKDYLRDLNIDDPEKAQSFIREKDNVFKNAESQVKQAIYYKEHEDDLAAENAKIGFNMFQNIAGIFGITNPKEIIAKHGFDFSDLKTPEGQAALREIVWKPNDVVGVPIIKVGGNGNPNDLADKTATYFVDPQKLALKAFMEVAPLVFHEQMRAAEKAAFERGLNSRTNKEELNIPSVSNSSFGQKTIKEPVMAGNIDPNDFSSDDDQKLNALKEKIKQQQLKTA